MDIGDKRCLDCELSGAQVWWCILMDNSSSVIFYIWLNLRNSVCGKLSVKMSLFHLIFYHVISCIDKKTIYIILTNGLAADIGPTNGQVHSDVWPSCRNVLMITAWKLPVSAKDQKRPFVQEVLLESCLTQMSVSGVQDVNIRCLDKEETVDGSLVLLRFKRENAT